MPAASKFVAASMFYGCQNLSSVTMHDNIEQLSAEDAAWLRKLPEQAVFEADAGDTVTLRTSEAINIATTNAQPLFTLTLVKLD